MLMTSRAFVLPKHIHSHFMGSQVSAIFNNNNLLIFYALCTAHCNIITQYIPTKCTFLYFFNFLSSTCFDSAGLSSGRWLWKELWHSKGKSVPLQAWSGPECSRKLRFPDFMTTAQDGGKFVSLTHRPPLPPSKYSWYSFLLETVSTPGP